MHTPWPGLETLVLAVIAITGWRGDHHSPVLRRAACWLTVFVAVPLFVAVSAY